MKIKYLFFGILVLFLLFGIAFTAVIGFIFVDTILYDGYESNNNTNCNRDDLKLMN